jgi:large subunit ribosomal protein L15
MNIHDVCVKRKHVRKRVGRGTGSGHGKTAGKGGKGQSARTGGKSKFPNRFFEGGQMPLIRRIPKRGFTNSRFRTDFIVINLYRLAGFTDGETVSEETLKAKGVISGEAPRVKLLGKGEIQAKLKVSVTVVSKGAAAKITAAGGEVTGKVTTPRVKVVKPRPVKAAPAAKGDKQKGDKPKGEKPKGDKPKGDKPKGEKHQGAPKDAAPKDAPADGGGTN